MRKIFILLSLFGILCARENPFAPVEEIKNELPPKDGIEPFSEVKFRLPDSSRILKSLKISYQNLDGSIDEKIIYIDKKIDWHNPFVLKQYTKGESKNIKSSSNKKTTQKSKDYKTYSFRGFIRFQVTNSFVKIITKDTKIRDFMVTKPYKVVIDFKRDANFLTKTFRVDTLPFKSIILGNHDKYYRVVLVLDGHYIYNLKKDTDSSYIITLR